MMRAAERHGRSVNWLRLAVGCCAAPRALLYQRVVRSWGASRTYIGSAEERRLLPRCSR
jgi:hypothetical protein